ncbi:helix-turn-helix transcriptional regulator [Streptomyces sp. NBC_01764]|uniref:helix-turn-helix domain-containing protein n=1 Tax=Streptomyces sp. NBC_01764 TaxID=2975935 RepID=UPI002258800D|nr:helix-turn-helix transcriptional regulator [Streptomyces sp. NBC_01764]MCX4411612.1 helix-turn-helix transcriptional regulator [Streptomyces sp. NBC_01764]
MDDLRPSLAQVPPHLLHDPKFVQAARDHDFPTLFAMAHGHGVSYYRLSEACGIKPDRVSLIARGKATVTALDTIVRVADALRIPGAHLGLAARPWENSTPLPRLESDDDGDDPMNRRQLLRGALAAGLTGAALTALTDTRQSLDLALAADTEPADLSDLEAAAETYGYGYHGQPPSQVLADLVTDFGELRPLLSTPQPVATRIRVCRTAGQMAGMTAIVLMDLGARRHARSWFATAATAARESGDKQLLAWLLAREAMVPLNYGAPQAAAQLAERARLAAGDQPTAAATLAAAVAARAYALSHQVEQAREALTAADAFMERLPAGARADTWLTHGEQKHHVHLSHALTALGDTGRARESQNRALELSAPTSTMTRSLLRIDAAACLRHDGDPEQACRRTVAVMDGLPDAYRTGLVHRRALDLYRSIPTQHHREAAVRQLRDVLAA